MYNITFPWIIPISPMLSIIGVRPTIWRQCWVCKAMVALDADEEKQHARFFSLRLILIEYSTKWQVIYSTSRGTEIGRTPHDHTGDKECLSEPNDNESALGESCEVLVCRTSVGSAPKSVVTPTCSLWTMNALRPAWPHDVQTTHLVTVNRSFLYTHLFSPISSYWHILQA